MNLTAKILLPLLLSATTTLAQEKGSGVISPAPPASAPTSPPADVSPDARALLQLLHDRKSTLKDFTAQIDNSVMHLAGDSDGNLGTVDYTDDPKEGPRVSVHFTDDTTDGKPFRKHDRYIVLDSKALTLIDFKEKQFHQQLAPPGKPFNPSALDSPIPIPIGIDVDSVIKEFQVTLQPSPDPNLPILRLIPRVKGTYDFTQFDITLDKKLQLPIKFVAHSKGGDITTIKFFNPQINTGKAKIADTTPPTAPGWNIEIK